MIALRLLLLMWQGFGISGVPPNTPIVVASLNFVDMPALRQEYWHVFSVRRADGSVRTKVVYGSFDEPSVLSTTAVTTTVLVPIAEGHWLGTAQWRGQGVRWALDIKAPMPFPTPNSLQPVSPSILVHWCVKSRSDRILVQETRSVPGESNFVLIMP